MAMDFLIQQQRCVCVDFSESHIYWHNISHSIFLSQIALNNLSLEAILKRFIFPNGLNGHFVSMKSTECDDNSCEISVIVEQNIATKLNIA